MKKIVLFLAITLFLPLAARAEGDTETGNDLAVYRTSYIWGQSARNNSHKGSAIDLIKGRTYSLSNALSKSTPAHIDLMCFWGKVEKGDKEKKFYFFAPGAPTEIDWTEKTGTLPYCDMVGSPTTDATGETSLKNWSLRNITKLQKIDTALIGFDTMTYEKLQALNISSDKSYLVENIRVGDVILFETASTSVKPGKKGLIKIVAIEDDPEKPELAGKGSNQKLNLIIKVQK